MEVVVSSPQGNKPGNTNGVQTPAPKQDVMTPRRISVVDIDGPVGEFLGPALCMVAPLSFNVANWKGKLINMATDNNVSFLCCGRAVGLADIVRDPMTYKPSVRVLWLLAAEGGTKEDAYEILKAQKRWARSLDADMILPSQDYTNIPVGKMKDFFKTKPREVHVIEALVEK